MRRPTAFVAVALLLAAVAGRAEAAFEFISVGPGPGGTGSGTFDGNRATVLKHFTSIADIPITTTMQQGSEVDHSSQFVDVFSFDEQITNNTGIPWTDFHFVLQPIDADPNATYAFGNASGNVPFTTALGLNSLSLFFSPLVPSPSTFSVAFDLTVNGQIGAFNQVRIHEFPTVAPEPASLVIWSLLGLTLVGARWVRRRRRA